MQYQNNIGLTQFSSQSNPISGYNSQAFSQSIHHLNNENNASNNCQTIPETEISSTIPIISTDLSSQWMISPFNTSAPLMSTSVSSNHSSFNASDVATILASNFVCSPNSSQFSTLSLTNSIDSALTSLSSGTNSSNKDIIGFKTCCLYPPKHKTPILTTRERPLGCRTVFVGGLPENINDEVLMEVFQSICGQICAIRMSKKNFCHIRFDNENSVDKAIVLSGYRIKINDLEDMPNTGRLHIDYAQARDDQYEWECKQRSVQRQMRHRERLEYDRFCPPSPPTVHFSDHEAIQLIDRLKSDQSFMSGVQVLVNWLERGECQKRNCGQFYAMIQSTNNHIRRLQTERTVHESEWLNARQLYNARMQTILVQFSQIEKVFEAAVRQKAWDHFTKAQRKNIDVWYKQTKEIKNAQVNDAVNKREEDEMDLSDGEPDSDLSNDLNSNSDFKQNFVQIESNNSEMSLRDENDSLKCQVESFRSEAVMVQVESQQEKEYLLKQIEILQKALQGMQHQLIGLSQQKKQDDIEIDRLKTTLKDNPLPDQRLKTSCDCELLISPNNCSHSHRYDYISSISPLLISLISIYFNVHPYGTTTDDISQYLKQQSHLQDFDSLTPKFIESLLTRFPQIFAPMESDSCGKKIWRYCGFQAKDNNHN